MIDKKELRKLRKKAIKIQNNAFPRKVSMAEAIALAKIEEAKDDSQTMAR